MHPSLRLLLACCGMSLVAGAQEARHVAAPPEDIAAGYVVLPAASDLEVLSGVLLLEPEWRVEGGGWVATLAVPVDRAGPLELGLAGVGAADWAWELGAPGAALQPATGWVAAGARRVTQPLAPDDPREVAGLVLDHAPAGTWSVRLRAPGPFAPVAALLAARTAGAGEVRLHSHLGSHARLSDRALPVVARLQAAGAALRDAAGEVLVESASGRARLALLDDGLHADGAPGDGVFGAWLGPLPPGPARVALHLRATAPGGLPLLRSARHAFTVEPPAVRLPGVATTTLLDAQRLAIDVALQPLGAPRRLQLAAEAWARDARGTPVPVAWLGTIGLPPESFGPTSLALHLDGRWLARAGATGGLELRRVRVQDPDSHVVLDELDLLPLPAGPLPPSAFGPPGDVTTEMLVGPQPGVTFGPGPAPGPAAGGPTGAAGSAAKSPVAFDRALLLSHGYCSSGVIWPAADFAQPKIVFVDANANRSQDEFAQLLAAAGASKDSFGVVAHSQGGLAALHLLTWYQSGLDYALGPRRIQALASPWLGTPLASLGFFACGVNDDLTTSGAPLWLSGIPGWARQEVFFWTTQNDGSACNFFTDLVLGDPNDGTVEKARGQLAGGNNMGHVAGWCHTTGMSDPASYLDHARNAEMDAQAAR